MEKTDTIKYYLRKNKSILIITTISGLFFDGLMGFIPLFQGHIIDLYDEKKENKYLLFILLLFFLFVFFVQINRFFKRYYCRLLSNKMNLEMRRISYRNILMKDTKSIGNDKIGDLINKNLNDIYDTTEGVRKVFTEIFDSIVLLAGYLIILFIRDYKTTLIISLFFILSSLISLILKKRVVNSITIYKKEFSKAKQETYNIINNEIYYRSLGVNNNYDHKYENNQKVLFNKSLKKEIYITSLQPLYNLVCLIGLIFVIYNGLNNVLNNYYTKGDFSSYLALFILISDKISKLSRVFNSYQKAKVSYKRCKPFLKSKELKNLEFDNSKTILNIKDLNFSFNDSYKLTDFNLNINKPMLINICGRIHQGKSTLASVLSGIYDYEGSIKLNNIELKEVKDYYLKNFISYLPNEVDIFNLSFKVNITLKDTKDFQKAINSSCLSNDMNTLKDDENTLINHSIINLSGGQEKRLGIARCLYDESKMIILDDPFNSIDLKMSLDILNNIKTNYQNSIIFIVSNQKEIIKETEKIIYMDNNTYYIDNYDNLLKNNSNFNLFIRGELK